MKSKIIAICAIYLIGSIAIGAIDGWRRTRPASASALKIDELQDLSDARQFEQVVAECDEVEARHEADPEYEPYFLYLQWSANCQLSRFDEAKQVQDKLMRRYPTHIAVAKMRFSLAVNLIGRGEYIVAEDQLASIERDFPASSISRHCHEIDENLSVARINKSQLSWKE
jgi:hypothetical protein